MNTGRAEPNNFLISYFFYFLTRYLPLTLAGYTMVRRYLIAQKLKATVQNFKIIILKLKINIAKLFKLSQCYEYPEKVNHSEHSLHFLLPLRLPPFPT